MTLVEDRSVPSAPPAPESARTTRRRLSGVDLARGIAVLGMFAAHVGPAKIASNPGPMADVLAMLTDGHASILFATLAGVSLALFTGGSRPQEGLALRRSRVRIAVRALLLFLLGLALTELGTPVAVILSFYAVYFLFSLPLLRLRPGTLCALAAILALAAPQVSFVLRTMLDESATIGGTPMLSGLTSFQEALSTVLELLISGVYPALTWMPFVLAGLAIGRMDLRLGVVRLRVLGAGVGLAILGYSTSWLAMDVLGAREVIESFAAEAGLPSAEVLLTKFGAVSGHPAFLLIATPHSGTTFEIIGSGGCALAAISLCLVLADRLRTAFSPIIAVGTLALTVYTAQVIVLALFPSVEATANAWLPLLGFVLVTVVFCVLWQRYLGRGPLERLMHWASTTAARTLVRVPRQ